MYDASPYPRAMLHPFMPTKKPRSPGGASSAEYTGAGRIRPVRSAHSRRIALTDGQETPTAPSSDEPSYNEHSWIHRADEQGASDYREGSTVIHAGFPPPFIQDIAASKDAEECPGLVLLVPGRRRGHTEHIPGRRRT